MYCIKIYILYIYASTYMNIEIESSVNKFKHVNNII